MKYIGYIKKAATVTLVTLAVWFLWPAPQQVLVKPTEVAKVEPRVNVDVMQEQATQAPTTEPVVQELLVKESATLIASAYAAEINFPPYSQPLTVQAFDRLNPNHFYPQSLPINDDGDKLTGALSKYRYIYPEPIVINVSGNGLSSASVELFDASGSKKQGKSIDRYPVEVTDNTGQLIITGEQSLPTKLQANINADIQGKSITMSLAFQYVSPVATLDSIDQVISQDADMVVPVNMTTQAKGLYRIRANLFDANGQPVAFLSSKQKLGKGQEQAELKAHRSVLDGRQAPFYLSTFVIELMSPAPGVSKKFGISHVKKHVIKDFAVSSLSDTPYQPSEQEQQRLELLKVMSEQ